MTEVAINNWLWLWAIAAGFTLARHWRTGVGSGLVFAYVMSFGAMHALAPVMYVLPWYDSERAFFTGLGLRESAIAMVAFAAGTELARLTVRRQAELQPESHEATPTVDNRIVNLYLIAGLLAYALTPLLARLPSGNAIVSAGSTLGVVAIGLKCWNAWAAKRWTTLWLWLAGTTLMPFITVLGQGFLGYGFAAMLSVMAFVASFYRPRWQVVAASGLLLYLGLSVYVTYMRDRDEIRSVVWAGASVEERVSQLQYTASTAEWFNAEDQAHLQRVDTRLNQDFLIGAAVVYLEGGMVRFAGGETLIGAVAAVVPRALWPDKPSVAGSGTLVADFTGITFAEGTSVGVGQVLEAYVNFGRVGIVIGFFLVGSVLSYVDRQAQSRLRSGEVATFLRWYLPGLALLQVGGSFAEVTSTAGAAWLVAVGLGRVSHRLYPDRRDAPRSVESSEDRAESPEALR